MGLDRRGADYSFGLGGGEWGEVFSEGAVLTLVSGCARHGPDRPQMHSRRHPVRNRPRCFQRMVSPHSQGLVVFTREGPGIAVTLLRSAARRAS